jgi:hypothetical protein
MTNFNIWSQIALMIQRVRRRREHFVALAAAVKQATLQVDEQLTELKLERDDLRHAEEHYNETLLTLQKKKEQDKMLHREKSRPGVQNIAKQISAFKKKGPSTSHGSSVNPFTRRSSFRQSTPIGKRPGYFELNGDSSEEPTTSEDEDKIDNVSTTHPTSNILSNNNSDNDSFIKESQDNPVKDEPKNTDLKSD